MVQAQVLDEEFVEESQEKVGVIKEAMYCILQPHVATSVIRRRRQLFNPADLIVNRRGNASFSFLMNRISSMDF